MPTLGDTVSFKAGTASDFAGITPNDDTFYIIDDNGIRRLYVGDQELGNTEGWTMPSNLDVTGRWGQSVVRNVAMVRGTTGSYVDIGDSSTFTIQARINDGFIFDIAGQTQQLISGDHLTIEATAASKLINSDAVVGSSLYWKGTVNGPIFTSASSNSFPCPPLM